MNILILKTLLTASIVQPVIHHVLVMKLCDSRYRKIGYNFFVDFFRKPNTIKLLVIVITFCKGNSRGNFA